MVSQTSSASARLQENTLATATNGGLYWSQGELNSLFSLFDEGHSLSDIAIGLKRTYYAVSKMHELGLKEATSLVDNYRVASKPAKRVLPYDLPSTNMDLGDDW